MDLPTQALPEPLPSNPFTLLGQWLKDARADAAQPNPDALVLASVDARGQPSARVVLCKGIDVPKGLIQFHTNYDSRKGRELQANAQVAAVFHWDHRHRQVRIEGRAERMSAADSDAYFASRPWQSRIGAWASEQSRRIESLAAVRARVAATAQRFGIPYAGPGSPEPGRVDVDVPRPPHWGGFNLIAHAVELWVEGRYRIHERVRWTRTDAQSSSWAYERLQP
jgi:pyridoxamine 5'-phosphate oxidase